MRWYLIALLFVGCSTTPPVAPVVPVAAPRPIAPLDERAAYLDAAVAGKSVVLLGESLHGTDEFPRVRLPLLRRLHESLGYDVLAVEGSAMDAWLAQDELDRGVSIEDASREAWLMLWNTEAMRSVLRYARDSKMYLASMDIQPAMGGSPVKKGLIRAFVGRLVEYAGSKENADDLAEALLPLKTCQGKLRPDTLERITALVQSAIPAVRAKSPMHAEALDRIVVMFHQRKAHCEEAAGDGPYVPAEYWKRYKEARDRYQAFDVAELQRHVSRTHRLVVWAHHSHAGYESAGASAKTSLAGELRRQLPNATYSIGVFGGSGRFLEIHDGPSSGSALVDVKESDGLKALAALSPSPSTAGFFVDLRRANPAFAHEEHAYPLEGQYRRYVLDRNFDGAIFVPSIHEATID